MKKGYIAYEGEEFTIEWYYGAAGKSHAKEYFEDLPNKFIESLTSKELKEYERKYKEFALSELVLAIMERDEISVRKLAKIAGVSPTIVQEMKSGLKKNYNMESFFKILNSLGFDQFMVGRDNQFIPIDLSYLNNK